MPISFACKCGKKLVAKEQLAGKKIKCTGCGAAVVVPQGQAPAPQPASTNGVLVLACSCGKRFKAKRELIGKRIKCPACQSPVTVAEVDTTEKQKASAPSQAVKSGSPPAKSAAIKAGRKPPAPPPEEEPFSEDGGFGAEPSPAPKTPSVQLPKPRKKKSIPYLMPILGGVLAASVLIGVAYWYFSLPTSATVTGVVILDKQLVIHGKVELITEDKKKIFAPISSMGVYTLQKVPFGEAVLTVSSPLTESRKYEATVKQLKEVANITRQQPPPYKPANVPIPAEYTDPAKTPFKLKVENARHEFTLPMHSKK